MATLLNFFLSFLLLMKKQCVCQMNLQGAYPFKMRGLLKSKKPFVTSLNSNMVKRPERSGELTRGGVSPRPEVVNKGRGRTIT
jgi:hypothetical protein